MAQREAMEARAAYEMRNRITHKVLVMDPVLQAVHGGGGGGGGERTAAFAAKSVSSHGLPWCLCLIDCVSNGWRADAFSRSWQKTTRFR